jgi:hypothetical protein
MRIAGSRTTSDGPGARRRARPGRSAAAIGLLRGVVIGVLLGLGTASTAAAAGSSGSGGIPFAEAFDGASLVVVATVEAAPPADAAFRLTVEAAVKGASGDATTLHFPADATSVTLVPGTRVVLLAMDPRSLDFRGTWALAVAPDGTIDGDGLGGAPASVDALLAAWRVPGASATAPGDGVADPSGAAAAPGGGAGATDGSMWLVAAGFAALAALVVGAVAAGRRTRRTRRTGM